MLKREQFRLLKWDDDNIALPIFTKNEIELEPTRWLKNLLLERAGLRSTIELSNNIQRYRDIHSAKKGCQSMINGILGTDVDLIIKLVPFDQLNSLSNYHIYSLGEVDRVFNNLSKDSSRNQALEIWLCWLYRQIDSLSGRLSLGIGKIATPNVLEIVWSIPRQIEILKYSKNEFPFLRASKAIGHTGYSIDQIYIPNNSTLTQQKVVNDYEQVMISIYNHQECVDRLGDILNKVGINELCLEFVSSYGKLKFIDWDI